MSSSHGYIVMWQAHHPRLPFKQPRRVTHSGLHKSRKTLGASQPSNVSTKEPQKFD